jgi:hypothetical protein
LQSHVIGKYLAVLRCKIAVTGTATSVTRVMQIDLSGQAGERLINLGPGQHSQAGPDGVHKIVLEAYGYRWYRVGGLGHILKREKY